MALIIVKSLMRKAGHARFLQRRTSPAESVPVPVPCYHLGEVLNRIRLTPLSSMKLICSARERISRVEPREYRPCSMRMHGAGTFFLL